MADLGTELRLSGLCPNLHTKLSPFVAIRGQTVWGTERVMGLLQPVRTSLPLSRGTFQDLGGLGPWSRARQLCFLSGKTALIALWRDRGEDCNTAAWSEYPAVQLSSLGRSPNPLHQSSLSYSPSTNGLFTSRRLSTESQPHPPLADPQQNGALASQQPLPPGFQVPLHWEFQLQPASFDLQSSPRPPGA